MDEKTKSVFNKYLRSKQHCPPLLICPHKYTFNKLSKLVFNKISHIKQWFPLPISSGAHLSYLMTTNLSSKILDKTALPYAFIWLHISLFNMICTKQFFPTLFSDSTSPLPHISPSSAMYKTVILSTLSYFHIHKSSLQKKNVLHLFVTLPHILVRFQKNSAF